MARYGLEVGSNVASSPTAVTGATSRSGLRRSVARKTRPDAFSPATIPVCVAIASMSRRTSWRPSGALRVAEWPCGMGEAAEQGDEADEARSGTGTTQGVRRVAPLARNGATASQLIAGVRLTRNGAGGRMRAGRGVRTGGNVMGQRQHRKASLTTSGWAGKIGPACTAERSTRIAGLRTAEGCRAYRRSGGKALAAHSPERPSGPTESLEPMWQLASIACRLPRPGCSRFGNAASWWVTEAGEQGDEADEALGGAAVRTARNARRAGAASCPRGEHGCGHRFAAYRQCSVDTGTPAKDAEDETGAAGGRNARRASGAMHGRPCRALAGAARWRKQGSHRATWHGWQRVRRGPPLARLGC